MTPEYFVAGGTPKGERNRWKVEYLVKIHDRLLGELWCSESEAFSAEELEIAKRKPHSRLESMRPVDFERIPGRIQKRLTEIVASASEEY